MSRKNEITEPIQFSLNSRQVRNFLKGYTQSMLGNTKLRGAPTWTFSVTRGEKGNDYGIDDMK